MYQEMSQADAEGKTLAYRFQGEAYRFQGEEGFGDCFHSLVGISESQQKHLDEKLNRLNDDSFNEAQEKFERVNRWRELSPEELVQADEEVGPFFRTQFEKSDSIFKETLTPPQLQAAREYELTLPSVVSQLVGQISNDPENVPDITLNFDAYQALDLSDEQKEKLAELQKESDKEMQPILDDVKKLMEILLEDQANDKEPDMEKLTLKVLAIRDKAASNAKKTKEKLEQNLTPEQRERLAKIREEMPQKLAKIKEELAKKKAEPQRDDSWKDAWKPGDPLPEGVEPQQPKRRFPFGM